MATIQSYNKRFEALKSERSTFIAHWRDLSDYHLAYRGRFLITDRNKGYKRNTKQINNTSRLAVRTIASGMMAGITSPSRPWFRLSSGDVDLDDGGAVKEWLHAVQVLMYRVFSSSNLYNSLHALYSEMAVFGTGAMGVYRDFNNVIWCKTYTAGAYCLAQSGKGEINTFYRDYQLTVAQLVKEFGLENCSISVQGLWKNGNTESWVDVMHVIEPNDDRDQQKVMAKSMPWRSAYYEYSQGGIARGGSADVNDKFLLKSGFEDFPIMAPRWDIAGEDIYGTDCPGMTCLGDTKALQLAEKRNFQAIDRVVSPPLQGPSTLKNKVNNGSAASNDIVWVDGAADGLKSIYDFKPDLMAIDNVISKAEDRIDKAFYVDLFLMLANTDRRQITAREIAEKHEEKLLMLGPVLERLHSELLDPLIDRTFNILQEAGALPPPPVELQNKDLSVRYVSVLAQAQLLVNTGALDRVSQFAAELSGVWPEARHKIDAIKAVDEYASALGVSPAVVRSDEQVDELMSADAKQAANAAAAEQGKVMADTAKTASEVDPNNLSEMAQSMGLQ